jgi:hypothetical protein
MPQYELDPRYDSDHIDVSQHSDTDPVEGLDQWQLSDFEDLVPRSR